MITLHQSTKTEQNYASRILTALLFMSKPRTFMKTLLMMLKNGLTHLKTASNRWERKGTGLFKDELGGKIMIKFVGLRAKTYAYLMDDNSEHKKAKGTKKCAIKIELIFKNY